MENILNTYKKLSFMPLNVHSSKTEVLCDFVEIIQNEETQKSVSLFVKKYLNNEKAYVRKDRIAIIGDSGYIEDWLTVYPVFEIISKKEGFSPEEYAAAQNLNKCYFPNFQGDVMYDLTENGKVGICFQNGNFSVSRGASEYSKPELITEISKALPIRIIVKCK